MFFINGEEEECVRREWGGPVRSVKRNGAEAERNTTGQWERGPTSWNLLYKLVIKIRRNDIIIQQEIEIRMQTSKSLINLLLRSRHHCRSTYSSDSICSGYLYFLGRWCLVLLSLCEWSGGIDDGEEVVLHGYYSAAFLVGGAYYVSGAVTSWQF
jgi:hypothetical protein